MTAPVSPADGVRPQAYRLVTPDDWVRVPLEREGRRSALDRLLSTASGTSAPPPAVRAALVQTLEAEAERALANGGVEWQLSLRTVAGFPLASALTVSLVPGPGAHAYDRPSLEVLAQALAQASSPSAAGGSGSRRVDDAAVEDLPGVGPAVRVRATISAPEQRLPGRSEALAPVQSAIVEWFVPVPHGRGALLLLSLSTPWMPAREAFEELFDQIARTLVWE